MKTQGKVWIIYNAESKKQTKPMSVVQAQVTLLSLPHNEHHKYFIWTPGWEEWTSVAEFLSSNQKYFVLTEPPKPGPEATQKIDLHSDEKTITTTAHSHTSSGVESPYTEIEEATAPIKEAQSTGYHFQDFNGDELDYAKIKKAKFNNGTIKKKSSRETAPEANEADRRKDPRHNFKIEVVLVSKVRSYRTYSKNISVSGTMLVHEIPKDFLDKPFDLIIVNPFDPDPKKARLLFKAKIVGDLIDARRLMFIEQDPAMTQRLDALLKAYTTYQKQMKKTAG